MSYIPFKTSDNKQFYTTDSKRFLVRSSGGSDQITIDLYTNTAEENRVDKSTYLTLVDNLTGTLREQTSIQNPTILIQSNDLPAFNYVYIDKFDRYYFLNEVVSIRTGVWSISLREDYLMSFKTGILSLTATIGRQENNYNDELIDNELQIEKEVELTYIDLTTTNLETSWIGSDDRYMFVLTCVSD